MGPPIEPGRLKLLHVSDLHFGQDRSRGDRGAIIAALRDLSRAKGFDVLVVSGDIAYSGLASQYVEAAEFVGSIARGRPVVVVPGNHDVDRSEVDVGMLRAAHFDERQFSLAKAGIAGSDEHTKRFSAFNKFASQYLLSWSGQTSTMVSVDLDQVRVVGLNTAIISRESDEDARLAVDCAEFDTLLAESGDRVVVVVAHHPLSMLVQWCRVRLAEIMARVNRGADLLLCGHLHRDSSESTHTGAGTGLVTIQSGAAYASEGAFSVALVDIPSAASGDRQVRREVYFYSPLSGSFELRPSESFAVPMKIRGQHSGSGGSRGSSQQATSGAEAGSGRVAPPALGAMEELDVVGFLSRLPGHDVFWVYEPERVVTPKRVFWPVRLRRPTLIHSTQAYIAAGLSRAGAEVTLCVDDFGNVIEHDFELLTSFVQRHYSAIRQDWEKLRVVKATALISPERLARTWAILQKWLQAESMRLARVLRVCKFGSLEGPDGMSELPQMLAKKSRRLMTPAVVWSCLDALYPESSSTRAEIVTLGGYDEKELWDAWREVFGADWRVGHVYNPKLNDPGSGAASSRPFAMGGLTGEVDALHWKSSDDVVSSIRSSPGGFSSASDLPGWLVRQCLLLPQVLLGGSLEIAGCRISSPEDVSHLDQGSRDAVVRGVSSRVAEVFFK